MNVTDRRQADGRAIVYSEREREFTFAKKHTWLQFQPSCKSFKTSYFCQSVACYYWLAYT